MTFARLPWFLLAIAAVAVAVLGWAYTDARREAKHAQAAAEAERLRASNLMVVSQEKQGKVEKEVERLTKENADLKSEIQRAAKLIKGASVDSAYHIVTQPGTVGGDKREPAQPKPPPSGLIVPRGWRSLAQRATWTTSSASTGRGWVTPAVFSTLAAAGGEAVAAPAPEPGDPKVGTAIVGGAPRAAPAARGLPEEGAAREIAAEGECVLAAGDTAEIVIDQVTLATEAGNKVVVGAAKLNRLEPKPATTVYHSKFKADSSKLVQVATDADKGRGWGLGVYGTAWDGGQSFGPAVALPSARVFGISLEGSVLVGIGPKFQVGALALSRF